ncbi:GGDEF domain-containing protein [Pseudoduganella sp. OTU4001]|uniref:GGDEF domain-containing protein n=1 Tax=Pseudoduganella sp. OTU4001 TaxID=3043854 RepID=UPI00313B83C6
MITLHVSTCALTMGIGCLAIGLAYLGLRTVRDGRSAGSNWSMAAAAQGLAWILVGLRGQIPDVLSILLVSVLATVSAILLYLGTEGFTGTRRAVHPLAWLVLLLLQLLPVAWFTYWQPDISARLILTSLVRTALLIPAIVLLWRTPALEGRRALIALLVTDAAWHLLRAASLAGDVPIANFFQQGPEQVLTLMLRGASAILIIGVQFSVESDNSRRALQAWACGLERESQQLEQTIRQRNEELRKLATTDFLTGMPNRREFLARAEQEISRARRHGTPLALLMLDVDRFKAINDRHGHAAGDQAIVAMARHCMKACRASDVAGRLGGEEFGLLLPHSSMEEAQLIAERLREGASQLPLPHGRLTISVGVASLEDSDTGSESLLLRADRALYGAKNEGRDCVRCG